MATKSFLKENVIETEQDAIIFLDALERAEKIAKKRKKIDVSYQEIKNPDEIKRMFTNKEK